MLFINFCTVNIRKCACDTFACRAMGKILENIYTANTLICNYVTWHFELGSQHQPDLQIPALYVFLRFVEIFCFAQ